MEGDEVHWLSMGVGVAVVFPGWWVAVGWSDVCLGAVGCGDPRCVSVSRKLKTQTEPASVLLHRRSGQEAGFGTRRRLLYPRSIRPRPPILPDPSRLKLTWLMAHTTPGCSPKLSRMHTRLVDQEGCDRF